MAVAARLPESEAARLEALHAYDVLDTAAEAAFDDLTLLASSICNTPVSLVSLVDGDRQWFKSRRGLELGETPREQAFCAYAILEPGKVLEVQDARADARFADNPLVTGGPRIRFYAGAPLVTRDGHALGSLCVIDQVPRKLDQRQSEALRALARQTVAQLELRAAHAKLEKLHAESRRCQETLEEYQVKLERINAQLQTQTVTDALTGLYNRAAFTQHLNQAIAHAQRYGEALSLVFIDADRFKALNDTFGHLAGDDALRRIADILRESSRKPDIAARYGGEEFAVVLPSTDAAGALIMAERFRRKVETVPWPHRKVTISLGVVSRQGKDPRCDAQHLVADADAALHRAKTGGRNQVMVAEPTG